MKLHARNIFLIILGSFIFAIGINFLAIPSQLSEGGVIGISILTHYLFGWSAGAVNLAINAVLMIAGWRLLNRRTVIYTLLSIIFCSFFLYLTEANREPPTHDPLLAAIFAGLLVGIGLGLVFLSGGTTGGASIVARVLNKYFGWSLGNAILVFDVVVISAGIFMIGIERTMYTFIAVYIGARMVDYIVEGFNTKRAVTIISPFSAIIAEKITRNMNRGATVLHGHGAYTKDPKEVLYVIINKQELMELKRVVAEVDAEAFTVIHEVHEVLGRGFSIGK
ncbi:YitT family protein [Chitinophaga sp.]|uniref:YitT family protein n=1 Tax=Chitinophaga sp. TaxID=1869181 RepID=UPI00262DE223|nr:YitT family protein [uncultured Chitinophaga sp.]